MKSTNLYIIFSYVFIMSMTNISATIGQTISISSGSSSGGISITPATSTTPPPAATPTPSPVPTVSATPTPTHQSTSVSTTPPTTPPATPPVPTPPATPAATTTPPATPATPAVPTPPASTPATPATPPAETTSSSTTPTPPTSATPTTTPAATPSTPTPSSTPAATTTAPTTTDNSATKPVPTPDNKSHQILISMYIQNNFEQDTKLNQIEILLANQTTPLVKNNLNIPIPAAKSMYSKGSITAFDITADNSVESFNGIKSITIDKNQITFDDVKTGSSLNKPIAITKKDGNWVLDK